MRQRLFSRRKLFVRSSLVVAVLCLCSIIFTLVAPQAHAARARAVSSSTGWISLTSQNMHEYIHAKFAPARPLIITPNGDNIRDCYDGSFWANANGLYVAAEIKYPTGSNPPTYAMLRARTPYPPDGWEHFQVLHDITKGAYVIESAANGLFVAEEQGDTGVYQYMLRARTPYNNIGPWEVFDWQYQTGTTNVY